MQRRRYDLICSVLLICFLVACDTTNVPTAPQRSKSLPSTIIKDVATIDGQEYYADNESGELVPTSSIQARIEHETSSASLSCNNDNCYAQFEAYHDGMWHWTRQLMHWHVIDADNNNYELGNGDTMKTGGTGCDEWLNFGIGAFCTRKTQRNSHDGGSFANVVVSHNGPRIY